jgi:hypothetical protein
MRCQSRAPAGPIILRVRVPLPRLSLFAVSPQAPGVAVARDKLVTILRESTFTNWMGDMVPS